MTRAGAVALLIALAVLPSAAQEPGGRALPPAADRTIDFAADVQPILEASCARCHARGRTKGGFSIESRETLLAGGDSGAAIVPGDSGASELVALVAGLEPRRIMPQKGSRLTAQQVGILRAWIDQGAPWHPGVSFARAEPRNLVPRRPVLPDAVTPAVNPIDRLLGPYYAAQGVAPSAPAPDRAFIRRMYLDVIGQLPPPRAVVAFTRDTRPDKRRRLARQLLADRVGYAEHWLTFWNDLLRNDYRGAGYIDGGRQQITRWLYAALVANLPFDRFVAQLADPVPGSEGFSKGIVWRGVVNASQAPEMQAAQNIAQVFMGVNLKCASCHDSFISDWQLSDAYGMAGIYADAPLPMVECDRPTGTTAPVKFLYPQVGAIDAAAPRAVRLKQLAAALTGERNGRLSRTFVNRIWARLMGRGLVEPLDDMERQAWHPDLLDWLAEDFVAGGYRVEAMLERILTSDAYARVAVDLPERVDAYTFRGPAVRRLTAEQFVDALAAVTGVGEEVTAGDFDFRVAGGAGAPSVRGQWISPPEVQHGASLPSDTDDAPAWYARGTFSLKTMPATAHVLFGTDRSSVLHVNGHKAAEEQDAGAARLIDIRMHLQPGRNVLAIRIGGEPEGERTPVPGVPADGELFAQVLIRRRLAASAGIETVAASNHAWRVSRDDADGWEGAAFEDDRWERAVERRATRNEQKERSDGIARGLAAAGRIGRARAALTVADPLTTALGRPSREQVVTSRVTSATTLQALELLNGQTLSGRLRQGAEALVNDGPRSPVAMIKRIYLRALGRPPTDAEAHACVQMIGPKLSQAGVEDLLWSVAMLPEFQLIY